MKYGYVKIGAGVPEIKVADPQFNVEQIEKLVLNLIKEVMIDGLIDRFESELKCGAGEAIVFATGENCKPVIANCIHEINYDSTLTLKGLARIYKNTVG